jgi:hypothetical protein
MRLPRVWLLVALIALVTGCESFPVSEEPLGEVAALKPEEWTGSWLNAQTGTLRIIWVIDADKGIIAVTYGQSCEPPSADARGIDLIQLRRLPEEKWYFPIFKRHAEGFLPDEAPPFSIIWLYYRRNPDVWLWYRAVQDRFKSLVNEGALPGRVEGGAENKTVVLGHLSPEHYKLIVSGQRPLVKWEEPAIFVRLPPGLDPCRKGEKVK